MAAVVRRPVPQTPQSRFLSQVEAKFRQLVEQSPDPQSEIREAARRLQEANLLWQQPDPQSSPMQAAFQMFGDNEALTEIWMDARDSGLWKGAETPEELVTALLPSPESLV